MKIRLGKHWGIEIGDIAGLKAGALDLGPLSFYAGEMGVGGIGVAVSLYTGCAVRSLSLTKTGFSFEKDIA